MENTCDYPSCPYAKLQEEMCETMGLAHNFPQQCPNYLEGIWKPKEGDEKFVKDCAPRRTLITVKGLFNLLDSNTAEVSKLRSEQEKLKVLNVQILRVFDYATKQIQTQAREQEKRISCQDSGIQS